jgi:copper chaperone
MAHPQSVSLSVPDVSCEHCVMTINGTLRQQPGVQDIQVDLEAKTVQFRFDPDQVSLDTIEAVLDDAGYPVAK